MSRLTIMGEYLGAGKTQEVGNNKLKVRRFWLDISEMNPNTPEFQLMGDKCDLVEGLEKGTLIEVSFNLSGRKITNKEGNASVITNLNAWKVDVIKGARPTTPPAEKPAAPATKNNDDDDLPF